MISQQNARRLLEALRAKETAETEAETYKKVILGQQQELAIAEARLATATEELNQLLEELSISDPPPPAPPSDEGAGELNLTPGKKAK